MVGLVGEYSQLLRILRNSVNMKTKRGWNADKGIGFTKADIRAIYIVMRIVAHRNQKTGILFAKNIRMLDFEFTWGKQALELRDLSLGETKEALHFVESRLIESGVQVIRRNE